MHCWGLRRGAAGGGGCDGRYLDVSSDSLTCGSQAVEGAEICACYSWVTYVFKDDLQSGRIEDASARGYSPYRGGGMVGLGMGGREVMVPLVNANFIGQLLDGAYGLSVLHRLEITL